MNMLKAPDIGSMLAPVSVRQTIAPASLAAVLQNMAGVPQAGISTSVEFPRPLRVQLPVHRFVQDTCTFRRSQKVSKFLSFDPPRSPTGQ